MSSNGILMALCGLTLATTVFVAANVGGGSDGRVGDLEQRLADAETRHEKQMNSLAKEIRGLRTELARDGSVESAGRPTRRAAAANAAADGGESASAAMTPAVAADGRPMEDVIAERVEARIDEQMARIASQRKNRSIGGEWKPSMEELDGELDLTEAQQEQMNQIFDAAHDEVYVLLKTQRLDGSSLLDDFVADLKTGEDASGATKRFFQRLLEDKVPGTDRTYLTDLIGLRGEVERQLGDHLDESQVTKLSTLNVDLLGVRTGHDPVKDYVESRLQ